MTQRRATRPNKGKPEYIFFKAELAASEDEDDKSPCVSKHGKPGRGIRKASRPPSEPTDPNGQVEPSQKIARSRKAPRQQSASDEERADQETAKKTANIIKIAKSKIRSTTPAPMRPQTDIRIAKRRPKHDSDRDSEDQQMKKGKDGDVSLGEDEVSLSTAET